MIKTMNSHRIQDGVECPLHTQLEDFGAVAKSSRNCASASQMAAGNWNVMNRMRKEYSNLLFVFALALGALVGNQAHAETQEMQDAILRANYIAHQSHHEKVTTLHLFAAMLEVATSAEEKTWTHLYFRSQLKIPREDLEKALQRVKAELGKLPTVTGNVAPTQKDLKVFGEQVKKLQATLESEPFPSAFLALSGEEKDGAPSVVAKIMEESLGLTPEKIATASEIKALPGEYFEELTAKEPKDDLLTRRQRQLYSDFAGRTEEKLRLAQELDASYQVTDVQSRMILLTGESGTGKTALVFDLADRIRQHDPELPDSLYGKRIVRVDMERILSDVKATEVLTKLRMILDEAAKNPETIVFVDQLNAAIPLKQGDGNTPMMPLLIRELVSANRPNRVIAAGSTELRAAMTDVDVTTKRKISEFKVEEPVSLHLLEIIDAQRIRIENMHRDMYSQETQVQIPRALMKEAITLSQRFFKKRAQPDATISLLTDAANLFKSDNRRDKTPRAVAKMSAEIRQLELKILELEATGTLTKIQQMDLEKFQAELDKAKTHRLDMQGDWQRGWEIRDQLANLRAEPTANKADIDKLMGELKAIQNKHNFHHETVALYHIAQKIYEETGIPLTGILGNMEEKILTVDKFFDERVFGQVNAVAASKRAMREIAKGLKDPKRPSSAIFSGTTGVGKTHLAKTEAEFLFGDRDAIIQLDMSEYPSKEDVYKLIGAPPGHVGYDDPTKLLDAVRERPFCVLLLDEIEKADVKIYDVLLQILEEGRMTDNKGRVVDFSNVRLIMTTNIGAETIRRAITEAEKEGKVEEAQRLEKYGQLVKRVKEILRDGDADVRPEDRKKIRPEILGRVNEVVVFDTLKNADLIKIFDKEFREWKASRDGLRGIEVMLTPEARARMDRLVEEQGNGSGARGIREIIRLVLNDPVSNALSDDQVGKVITENGRVRFNYNPTADAFELDVPETASVECKKSLAKLSQSFAVPKLGGTTPAAPPKPAAPAAPAPRSPLVGADGQPLR